MENNQVDPVAASNVLDKIEIKLACTASIPTLLALRAELMTLIAGPLYQRPWRPCPILTRAIALRKQVEIFIGQILLSQRQRGVRRDGGKCPNRVSIRSQGLKKSLAIKWQRRAAASYATERAFAVRCIEAADFPAAKSLLDQATKQLYRAKGDHERAVARAAAMLAKRTIGLHLSDGDDRGLGRNLATNMRRLARLSEEQFIGEVLGQITGAAPPLKMVFSDWAPDEYGNLSRTITA